MKTLASIFSLGFMTLVTCGAPAWSWTSPPPKPFSMSYQTFKKTFPNCTTGSCPIILEIDGFVAAGAVSGDGCAAATKLPEGLSVIDVAIVNSKTGASAGFGKFQADALATRGFCGKGVSNCLAFRSEIMDSGVKKGTPLKVIISMQSGKRDPDVLQLTSVASRLVKSALFVSGGVDKNGDPHHHLSIVRPGEMELVLPEKNDK